VRTSSTSPPGTGRAPACLIGHVSLSMIFTKTGFHFRGSCSICALEFGAARRKMRHVPLDRALDQRGVDAGRSTFVRDALQHALDQIVVVLVR